MLAFKPGRVLTRPKDLVVFALLAAALYFVFFRSAGTSYNVMSTGSNNDDKTPQSVSIRPHGDKPKPSGSPQEPQTDSSQNASGEDSAKKYDDDNSGQSQILEDKPKAQVPFDIPGIAGERQPNVLEIFNEERPRLDEEIKKQPEQDLRTQFAKTYEALGS